MNANIVQKITVNLRFLTMQAIRISFIGGGMNTFSARTLTLSLALATFMLFATPPPPVGARAGSAEYGASDAIFTVDVPDDWTAKSNKNGVLLTSKDKESTLGLLAYPAKGMTIDAFVADALQNIGLKNAKKQKDGSFLLTDGKNTKDMTVHITQKDKHFVIVISAGPDKKGMQAIADSLELKKIPEKSDKTASETPKK